MIQSKEVLCVSFDLLFLILGFQVRSEPLKVVGVDQIDPCSNEFVPQPSGVAQKRIRRPFACAWRT